jgi:hypothetical protein
MRNQRLARMKLLSAAVCALTVSPVMAAPPPSSDDLRVGAPPVIVVTPATKPKALSAGVTPPVQPVVPKPSSAPLAVRAPVAPIRAAAVAGPVTIVAARPAPIVAAAPRVVAPAPMPLRSAALPPMQERRPGGGLAGAGLDHGGSAGSSYHRPEYGYQIPAEWTAPDHFIADYDSYGLSRPARGFGWSRYYDDAVLTDQWGRIYDWRDDVNWADHDDRYAGNRGDDSRDDDRGRDRKPRGRKYDYKGRWTGSWDGGPKQTYQGEWHGNVRPHWNGGDRDEGNRNVGYGGGRGGSYSYDNGGTTVTIITQAAAPVMSTETISYDVVSYEPVRAKPVRRYKPRPKPVCACGS